MKKYFHSNTCLLSARVLIFAIIKYGKEEKRKKNAFAPTVFITFNNIISLISFSDISVRVYLSVISLRSIAVVNIIRTNWCVA